MHSRTVSAVPNGGAAATRRITHHHPDGNRPKRLPPARRRCSSGSTRAAPQPRSVSSSRNETGGTVPSGLAWKQDWQHSFFFHGHRDEDLRMHITTVILVIHFCKAPVIALFPFYFHLPHPGRRLGCYRPSVAPTPGAGGRPSLLSSGRAT